MARPWRIVITGEGPSRNDKPDDADAILRGYVAQLRDLGHTVKAATLQDDTGKNYPLEIAATAGAAPSDPPVPPTPKPASVAGPQSARKSGTRNPGDGQA